MNSTGPADEPVTEPTSHRHHKAALLTALAVITLDQITKQWAVQALDNRHVIDVIWTLRLRLVRNSGAAFGSFQGAGPMLGVLAIAVVVILLTRFTPRAANRWVAVASGCIAGGAVGNVADRLFRSGDGFLGGAVIDFIDVQWWPVWNVADMGVVLGAAVWLWCARRLSVQQN